MVFCYKVITETPNRSGAVSPVRRPAQVHVPSSLSQLIGCLDYEDGSEVLDDIPERDWRLLAVLAKKREEDVERERLADQFRDMWRKEKEDREMVEAETMEQYKRYLHEKRQQERSWLEYRQLQKTVEHQLKRGELLDCIRHKERRSKDVLAFVDDKKRVAISNALSSWESSLLRHEVGALEAARRAAHAARAALTDARSVSLARARDVRLRRARKMAAVTARMREAIRSSRTQ